MPQNASSTRILPEHIEGTVEAIAQLHAEHYKQSPPLQKVVDRMTARAGQPGFVATLTVVVLAWMALNLAMVAMGRKPWDEPPFFWLQGAVALTALYMTLLILATQRREDQLASRREQLTLELSILSEQKSAKIIELLEELRRDLPMLKNRIDQQAVAMSVPADPQAVFDAIKDKHEEQVVQKNTNSAT
jgi:uncharacterized membrane protein